MPQQTAQANLNKLSELENRPVGRLLWEYSLPAVVGMIVTSLYNVIDRIFIGQGVGADAIAGLAITFPVMNLSAAIGVLIGAGAGARTSIVLGRKDHRTAEHILGNSLTLTLVNALIYLSFFTIFIDDILLAFGASDKSLPYARDFMLYLIPGMLMINLTFNLNNVMRASGYPTRAMVTMFIGALANLILAPVFIFWLDMGIKGAAIATDLSMTISGIFVVAHFMSKKSTLHFTRGTYRLKWKIVAAIISIGAAPSIVNAVNCLINIIINKTLYKYGGDPAVASAGIFTTFTQLLVSAVLGICQGAQPIIGYNYGARRFDRLRSGYKLSMLACLTICVVGSGFGIAFPEAIARMFTSDAGLIHVASRGIRIALLMFWSAGFQISSTNMFQSIGKAGKSIFLSLTRQVIFFIPIILILPDFIGLEGVWFTFTISDFLAAMVTLFMVIWQFRQIRRWEEESRRMRSEK